MAGAAAGCSLDDWPNRASATQSQGRARLVQERKQQTCCS